MVFLNQNQIIGDVIPDVLISKITLQTRGDNLVERNPHIDSEREPDIVRDPRTGKLERRSLAQTVSQRSFSGDPLHATIDLILQDKQDDSLVSTWFDNEDFKKYIRVSLFQVQDEDIFNAINQDEEFLDFLLDDNFRRFGAISSERLFRFTQLLGLTEAPEESTNGIQTANLTNIPKLNIPLPFIPSNPFQRERFILFNVRSQFRRKIFSGIQRRTLSVARDIEGDDSNITRHYREIDQDGNEVIKFVFRQTFINRNANPDHLSYFAFSYLDLPALARDFDMSLDVSNLIDPIGKISADKAIDQGRIVDRTFIYLDPESKIYTGIVQPTDNGFVGTSTNADPISLTRQEVSNSKVQDFRNFKDLENLIVDFSFVENEILRRQVVSPRKDDFNANLPKSYFTELNITRDQQGNSRFMFGIDLRKFLETNSKFGKIFAREKTSSLAIKSTRIISMEILRNRIKGSPEAGSAENPEEHFQSSQLDYGDNHIPYRIAISGEKKADEFRKTNNSIGSLQEIKRLSLEGQEVDGVRFFTGVDKSMSRITDGYYTYSVKLEVQDAVFDFLQKELLELINAKQEFEKFVKEATQVSTSSKIVAVTDPHIDLPGVERQEEKEVKIGNFDPYLNRFTQEFIDKQLRRFRYDFLPSVNGEFMRIAGVPPWTQAVNVYVSLLELFTDEQDFPFEEIKERLLFFIHPVTGNPEGLLKFLDLMEKLQRDIENALGISYGSQGLNAIRAIGKNRTATATKANRASFPIKSVTLQHNFKEVFDSNQDPEIGFDYLDIESLDDNQEGVRVVSGNDYETRIQRETDFYFVRREGINPNIDLKFGDEIYTDGDSIENTSWSYLSPSRIKFRDIADITRIGNSPTPKFPLAVYRNLAAGIRMLNYGVSPGLVVTVLRLGLSRVEFENRDDRSRAFELVSQLNVRNGEPIPSFENVIPNINIRSNSTSQIDPIVELRRSCLITTESEEDNIDSFIDVLADRNPIKNPIGFVTPPNLGGFDNPSRSRQLTSSRNRFLRDVSFRRTPIFYGSPFSRFRRRYLNSRRFNRRQTLSWFDLTQKNNILARILTNRFNLLRSRLFFQGAVPPNNAKITDAFRFLPNQIKSLYLSSVSPDAVKRNWFNDNIDPFKGETKPEFSLGYRNINTVLALRGFERDKEGKIQLKRPIWEPLTSRMFNNAKGDSLFCKMKPYSNNLIGIDRDLDAELSPYDEYFLLKTNNNIDANEVSEIDSSIPRIVTPRVFRMPVKVEIPQSDLERLSGASSSNPIAISIKAERNKSGQLPLEEIRSILADSRISTLNIEVKEPRPTASDFLRNQEAGFNITGRDRRLELQRAANELQAKDFIQTLVRSEFMSTTITLRRGKRPRRLPKGLRI